MKKKINMDILKQSDALTEDRIAEQFPAKWDMEHIYEKSIQKYLQKSESEPIRIQTSRKPMYRIIVMAACFLLTVGLSVGVWSKQQKIETRPPQETTTVIHTAPRTESTTQTVTAAQTTPTETNMIVTETTVSSTQVSEESSRQASEAALLTTVPKPTTTVATALQTQAAEESTAVIVPLASDTALPQTSPEIQTSLSANLQTRPITTEQSRTEMITTGQTTEIPETQATTESIATTVRLPGFLFSAPDLLGRVDVTYQQPVSPSPEEQYSYEMHLESCAVHEIQLEGAAFKTLVDHVNLRVETLSGSHFLGIMKRDVFQFYCAEDAVLTEVSVNGNPGVFIMEAEQCRLVWDDGLYKLTLTGRPEDQESMLEIAENLVPVLPEMTETEEPTSVTETDSERD